MPGDPEWENMRRCDVRSYFGRDEQRGIVVASLLAYLMGEFSNSVVLARMKVLTRVNGCGCVLSAALVGEGIDSLTFVLIATCWESFRGACLAAWL